MLRQSLCAVGHAGRGAVLLRDVGVDLALLALLHLLLPEHLLLLLVLVLLLNHCEEVARLDELGIGLGDALLLHGGVALERASVMGGYANAPRGRARSMAGRGLT